jgi:YidC/Oxa1 family membrane protein insertase
MDKKSLLAIVFITVIILLLPSYYSLIYDEPVVQEKPQPEISEEPVVQEKPVNDQQSARSVESKTTDIFSEERVGIKKPAVVEFSEAVITTIETQMVSAAISNQGGGKFQFWYLKAYDTWLGDPAKIIDGSMKNGMEVTFITTSGRKVNLNDYPFKMIDDVPQKIDLKAEENYTLRYELEIEGMIVRKEITIYGGGYHIDLQFKIAKAGDLLLNDDYEISWINGMPTNEINSEEDYSYSESYASMGGELENFSIDSEERVNSVPMNGKTDWIATRTKYFVSAIIPIKSKTTGAIFGGEGVKAGDILERRYNTSIVSTVVNYGIDDTYRIYMGPLDHSILSDYNNGLDQLVMNHGWYERTFRPISLFILKVFKFFQLFIPNYGLVIILFSILVKIVVYPLTKKSYKSMKEMSRVQPLLAELKEKYKSDPQRMNKETMKLYKEHGINPMGGCLPMLLQLPLLAALFIVFRSTIQLRGASFIPGWIDDLSRADTIFTLPFSLPMYGDQFNILPILMAGTMIFQSKMTMQDPKQKAMVYLMPVFMLLIFNQFPSGLNLYYTLFNLWTIIQQKITDGNGKPKKNK